MTSSSLPRGPKGHPLLGNALSLSRGALEFLRACAGEYGDLVPLRFLGKRILLVNHPDDIAQVLATNHRKVVKGITRRSDHILLGDGISLSEGDVWRRERRLMQPAFHRERIAAYGEVMVASTERMIETWRDGETRDMCVDLSELTMAVVGQTLLDINLRGEAAELPAALASAMACRAARARSLHMLLPVSLPTPTNLRMRRARRRIDDIVQRILEERRDAGDDRGDLLSMLLRAQDEDGRGVTARQVKDEVMAIFVGGHETVANLLAWAWYLLSQHPEVETRLLAELDTVLGGRLPTVSDLPRLPYTSTIVSEVLRLYPPASVLTREAIADVRIGAYTVARGTEIVVSPWVMHRDPRYFADPEVFKPDRWADGLASRLPRYAYFPFGGGPRLCIGKSFATMEAILVLAVVAQRFRLELLRGQRVVAEELPTLHPKFGLRMVVQPRQRGEARRSSSEMVASERADR
ncbi:MAG TPA: cytochrome P450 [Chloroflexota bacterium]|nr:cytochrome P450 [Chloroflexota bacterium]